MATLGASMVTLLTDNWAGAGATPTFGALIDFQMDLAPTTEQVIVRLPIHEDVDPINNILSNFKFTMQLRVKTTVSEDRLKVLTDETIRIINTYAITGITRQFAKRGENTSDRKKQVFSYDVWATLEEHASTAGTSYSSPGAGDVVFPADVTVTDDLITDNIVSANPISIRPGGNLVDYLEFDTVGNHPVITVVGGGTLQIRGDSGPIRLQPSGDYTDSIEFSTTANVPKMAAVGASDLELGTDTNTIGVDQIAELLMFGSGNAAYVSLALWGHKLFSYARSTAGYVENIGADNIVMDLVLTQPCTKGGLKLYISNLKFGVKDSDAADYITTVRIYGINENDAAVEMDIDATDHTSIGDKTFAGAVMPAAAIDCSAYQTIIVNVICVNSAVTAEMDIGNFRMECYYAA